VAAGHVPKGVTPQVIGRQCARIASGEEFLTVMLGGGHLIDLAAAGISEVLVDRLYAKAVERKQKKADATQAFVESTYSWVPASWEPVEYVPHPLGRKVGKVRGYYLLPCSRNGTDWGLFQNVWGGEPLATINSRRPDVEFPLKDRHPAGESMSLAAMKGQTNG